MKSQGLFREDLYFRLNVVPNRLPALRARADDIPELVSHFLNQATHKGLPLKIIDSQALDRLKAYRWPGNVRELENLEQRLSALYSQEVIDIEVIEAELADTSGSVIEKVNSAEGLSNSIEQHLSTYFSSHGDMLPATGLYDRILKEVERPLIVHTLQATRGNQLKASDVLGLNRNTLRKKIRELDIPVVRGVK